jgi:hypothetical protein
MPDAAAALLAALDDGRVDVATVAAEVGEATGQQESAVDDQAGEQFLRAFEALLREGLQGGREQRELVMESAVPALMANGQTVGDLVESHVAFFVALSSVMIESVEAGVRPDARAWLLRYAAEYIREVTEVALAAERAGVAERGETAA